MARKIRFPLKMKNGAEVRTLDELKENFDLESVLGYFADGKLATWLEDRYYDVETQKVSELDANSSDLKSQLCAILGVKYAEAQEDDVDIDVINRRNEKKHILSQLIDDAEVLNNIDSVALNQDDLLDCYDLGLSTIYLVGDTVFSIPVSITNVTYIGLCEAKVEIRETGDVDFNEKNIVFKDISFVGDIRPALPEESKIDNNHVIEETVKIHYSRINNYDLDILRDEIRYLYNKYYDEPVIEYSIFIMPEDDVLYYYIQTSSQTITDKRELFDLQDSRKKSIHREEYYKLFKDSTEKVFIDYLDAEYSLDSIRKAIENDYKSSFEGIVETIRIYIDLDSDSVPVIAYDINAGANSFSNRIKMK